MPQFDPELVRVTRNVLEEAMTRVPLEISNTTTKAYLAECILKTAAQGHTAYNELLSAATDQIQVIVSIIHVSALAVGAPPRINDNDGVASTRRRAGPDADGTFLDV